MTNMVVNVRDYKDKDVPGMVKVWNQVIEDGIAFPQEDLLNDHTGRDFFESQTACGVAVDDETGEICGLYILHPNNVGRCGHIANASYAVDKAYRGCHIGEKLVIHSLENARSHGFKIMQFNAVVAANKGARHLYEKLGFKQLGTIPGGFRLKDGAYEDICPYYLEL